MNPNKYKIAAFTLKEMLVVLVVTSIVISMGFTVLRLVQGQMGSISGSYQKKTDFNLAQRRLQMAFHQADGIWYAEGEKQLFFQNELKETTLILEANRMIYGKDTFQVAVGEIQCFYLGKPVVDGEIDALSLQTVKQQGARRVFVSKTNAATSFINP